MARIKGPRETAFVRARFTEPETIAPSGVIYRRVEGKWQNLGLPTVPIKRPKRKPQRKMEHV